MEEDEVMNSHDVLSRFINIPIKKALHVIRKTLKEEKTLSK